MEKLDESRSGEYSPVVLYLEDMEKIEQSLKVESRSFEIICEGYKYQSVSELASHRPSKEFKKLQIRAMDPYVTIEFSPYGVRLYVGVGGTKGAGIFYEIDEIIKNRRRRFSWIYSLNFTFFIMALGFITGILLKPIEKHMGMATMLLVIALFLVFLAWWTIWVGFKPYSVIRVMSKQRNIFVRNRDQLFVAVVSAVIGAILGAAIALSVGQSKIIKPPANNSLQPTIPRELGGSK